MRAGDAMTLHPVAVDPESSVADAVRIMLDKRISGLFVVDAKGDLRGIVTEGDLLRREELGTQRHRPWWLRAFVSPAKQAQDFTRSHGRRVPDVMTERVVSVPEDAALDEVVAAMEAHRIKRVAVVRGDRLVGVLSRSDLLRALVARPAPETAAEADDRKLRDLILDAIERQPWAPNTPINVAVTDGVAEIRETITDESERRAVVVLAENTPGVREVRDRMTFVEPYSGTILPGVDEGR